MSQGSKLKRIPDDIRPLIGFSLKGLILTGLIGLPILLLILPGDLPGIRRTAVLYVLLCVLLSFIDFGKIRTIRFDGLSVCISLFFCVWITTHFYDRWWLFRQTGGDEAVIRLPGAALPAAAAVLGTAGIFGIYRIVNTLLQLLNPEKDPSAGPACGTDDGREKKGFFSTAVSACRAFCRTDRSAAIADGIGLIIWAGLNFSGIQSLYFRCTKLLDLARVGQTSAIAYRILQLFLILILANIIHTVLRNRKETVTKHGIITGCVFFLCTITLLIMIWPGYWSWDDILCAKAAAGYDLSAWHHFFSGLFHILCLLTIPFPAGVVILQIVIASFIVGYCSAKIGELFCGHVRRGVMEALVLLVSLAPPLLEYILSGFRMGIYSYLEFWLLTEFLCVYKNPDRPLGYHDILKLFALGILVACWRTEAIYYILLVPVFLWLMGGQAISRKRTLCFAILFAVCTVGIGKYNTGLIGDKTYSLTASVCPVTDLVRTADPEKDRAELEAIDRVIDTELATAMPERTGISLFWDPEENFVRPFSDADYSGYMKAYAGLLLRYPGTALNCVTNIFLDTSGIRTQADGSPTARLASDLALYLFDEDNAVGEAWASFGGLYKDPIDLPLRNTVMRGIACLDAEGRCTPVFHMVFNLLIPMILCLGCWIYHMARKKWGYGILLLFTLCRIPLIFAASPAPYFMYYLSVYYMGYIWFIVTLAEIRGLRKR